MQRGRFSRLFVCNCETRTGAFLRAIAILCVTHVLSVSGSPKRVARQSCARGATAENREEASVGPHTPAGRRTSCRANTRIEKQVCAGLDASARCRHYGIVLQQRLAAKRTGCARRGWSRSLHTGCARFLEKTQRTCVF